MTGSLQDELKQGLGPVNYLYLKNILFWSIWSMGGLNKQLLTSYLIFIIILQNKHKLITLQLPLTIYNGSMLWAWKWTNLAKPWLRMKKQEKMWESPMPTEGKMAQPLEREQWSTGTERLLFCLGFTTMWRLALTISQNFPEVKMQQQLLHHGINQACCIWQSGLECQQKGQNDWEKWFLKLGDT